jgi:hypothetical protein
VNLPTQEKGQQMTIKKAHCFFEQSGTFKNAFKHYGIDAEDYDIQNNFGETENVVDLFAEIEKGYDGKPSIFDRIEKDDLIMAFFPCIKFCNIAEYNQRSAQEKWRRDKMPIKRIWELLKKQADERNFFYDKCLKLHATVECRGLKMIMENPWGELNYTNHFWFMKPSIIDMNRTTRGDAMVKPTAYWFLNCAPTRCESFQKNKKRIFLAIGNSSKRYKHYPKELIAAGSSHSGLCSEERSMISPDYAKNFIDDFLLGGGHREGVLQQTELL